MVDPTNLPEGFLETFDPELKRAFQVNDEVPQELRDPSKVIFQQGKLKVSGDFVFYTIQGEGITMGFPAIFMRLKVCNLRCVWCFPKGNKVLTVDGEKDISEIVEGDRVYSYRNKSITISRVNRVMKRQSDYLVKVKTKDDREVICTADHEFYINKRKSKCGNHTKLPAIELKDKYVKSFDGFFEKQELTELTELGYLKGAYLGDGYCNGKDKFQLSCIDYEFIEVIQRIVNKLGANCSILEEKRFTSSGNQVYRISTSKKEVIDTVLLPVDSYEELRGFIAGFFDAEGHLGRNYLHISQKDTKILERVKNIIEEDFHIVCSHVMEGTGASYFQISGKRNIKRFYEKFPVQISRKIYLDERRILDDVLVDKVENVMKTEDVYNIETTIGNYFVNNLLVGNCDAWYTWNPKSKEFWTEGEDWDLDKSEKIIRERWGCTDPAIQKRVVFTGGEPLLQKAVLEQLMKRIHPEWAIEVETNGTIMPTDWMLENVQFNCSPKLNNSENVAIARNKSDVIKAINKANSCFKFVVMHMEDLDEIEKDYVIPYGLDKSKVTLMPQGVTPEEIRMNLQKVAEKCKEKGYRLLTRLQVEIWGARRRV